MSTSTTAKKTEAEKATLTDEQRAEAVAKSYSVAMTALREKHLPEFNDLRVQAAKDLGVEWSPKPTKAEKAQAEIDRLLAENPELAAVYSRAAQPEDSEPQEPVDEEDTPLPGA